VADAAVTEREDPQAPGAPARSTAWRTAAACGLAALLSIAVVTVRFELWKVSLSVPFKYDRDALTCLMYVKALLDNGWYAHNHFIGMPVGWSFYDFPALHTLDFAIMKTLSVFVRDYAALANLYYLLTFPLAALCAAYALRQLRLSYAAVVSGALLYSVLPYHFFRGLGHLFLAAYYAVPLAIVLAVWVGGYTKTSPAGGRFGAGLGPRRRWLPVLVLCSVVALSHIYYVFFAILVLVITGLSGALTERRVAPLRSAGVVLALILILTAANYAPVFVHRATHGANSLVGRRTAREPLRLGLELSTLVLPGEDYGIQPLRRVLAEHRAAHRREKRRLNPSNYVGIPGVLGLVILLVALLQSGPRDHPSRNLRLFAELNAWLLLVASVGGLGYVFALLVTSSIRDYERVSVVVAFLALAALMVALDRLRSACRKSVVGRAACLSLLAVTVAVGVVDQTRPSYLEGVPAVVDSGATGRRYTIDAEFVRRIEDTLPARSMIFQLPHRFWPEGGTLPLHSMGPYDHFALYLHSKSLRYSYGAVRGRPGEIWLARTAAEAVPDMVESLCLLGFAGICIDRHGYSDSGEEIVTQFLAVLGTEPIESRDERRLFFELREQCDLLGNRYDVKEWENRQASEHIVWSFGRGFLNPAPGDPWRWCLPTGQLWIHNLADRPVECHLTIRVRTPQTQDSHLTIRSDACTSDHDLSRTPLDVVMPVVVPPGSNPLVFSSDAPSAGRRGERRHLAFLATEPRISDARWHRTPSAHPQT
jgi:phosphoglycerol transferase